MANFYPISQNRSLSPLVCGELISVSLGTQKGMECRLPTEFEWEYAARAGTRAVYYWGDNLGKNNANCYGCDSRWDNQQAAPVGHFKANPWKLYDMSGNVWEWTCSDYRDDSSISSPQQCSYDSLARVGRGGSWSPHPHFVRSSLRGSLYPVGRYDNVGFRVLCESLIE